MNRRLFPAALGIIIVITFLLVSFLSAHQTSQTIDELPHIAAGYSYWETGDFRLNPEHPPLAKLLAGLPLHALPLTFPYDSPAWTLRDQWWIGAQFLYDSGNDPFRILQTARLPMILIGAALLVTVWLFTQRRFGTAAGLVALAFIAFDPNVTAHAQLVTTDVTVTVTFFGTMIAFDAFARKPSTRRLIALSIVLGLALGSKFSALLLVLILASLWIIVRLKRAADGIDDRAGWFSWKRYVAFFVILVGVAFFVILLFYGLETMRIGDDPTVTALEEAQFPGTTLGHALNAIINSPTAQWFIQDVSIPGYRFFNGVVAVLIHNYFGHESFLLDHYSGIGWWYYFPVAFLVKQTTGTLIALAAGLIGGCIALWRRWRTSRAGRSWLYRILHATPMTGLIFAVPVVVYIIASITSHLNLGYRHLLPLTPFFAVAIGAAWNTTVCRRIVRTILALSLAGTVIAYAWIYPHYLSFFNIVSGGPSHGHTYLLDSNIDWGQDLIHLKNFLEKHDTDTIALGYFGTGWPSGYGIHDIPLPTNDEPHDSLTGYAAISVSRLYEKDSRYTWLLDYTPVARAGYSILIYDFSNSL